MKQLNYISKTIDQVFGYDIFIAYDSQDAKFFARKIKSTLSELPNTVRCFLDKDDYHPGDALNDVTKKMLGKSNYLLVIVTPRISRKDSWVPEEVRIFLNGDNERLKKIIVLNVNESLEQLPKENYLAQTFPYTIGPKSNESRLHHPISSAEFIKGPSFETADRIEKTLLARRVEDSRKRIVQRLVLMFIILVISIIGFAIWTIKERQGGLLISSQILAERASFELSENDDPPKAMALAWLGLPHQKSLFGRPIIPKSVRILIDSSFQKLEEKIIRGHSDGISCLKFSNDNRYLLSGSDDGLMKLWEIKTSQLIKTFKGEGTLLNVHNCYFDEQNKQVLGTYDDYAVRVFDIQNGEEKFSFSDHTGSIFGLTLSKDGSTIITASLDTTVRIWNAQNGKPIKVLPHPKGINTLALSKNRQLILTTSYDGIARIWNPNTYKLMQSFHGHKNVINSAVFDSSETRILTSGNDRTARLWDIDSGEEIQRYPSENERVKPKRSLKRAYFINQEKNILAQERNGRQYVWNTETNKPLRGFGSSTRRIYYDKNTNRAITISGLDELQYWDLESFSEVLNIKRHELDIGAVEFSGTGHELATGSDDGTIRVWNMNTTTPFMPLVGHSSSANSAIFSSDGSKILTSSFDGTVRLWDAQTASVLHVLVVDNMPITGTAFNREENNIFTFSSSGKAAIWNAISGKEEQVLTDHTGSIVGREFLSNDKTIFISFDKKIRSWDAVSGDPTHLYSGHSGRILSMKFHPDGKHFFSGAQNGTINKWRIGNKMPVSSFEGHDTGITHLAFNHDGKILLSTSEGGSVRFWDTSDGEEIYSPLYLGQFVSHALFVPSENRIVIATYDGTLRLFDGSESIILGKHERSINSLVFSPDGSWLLSASSDNTAKLWNINNNKLITTLEGHSGPINSARFSPNQQYIITSSDDETARIWKIFKDIEDPHKLINAVGLKLKNLKPLTKADCLEIDHVDPGICATITTLDFTGLPN